jgi:hypothetical protein
MLTSLNNLICLFESMQSRFADVGGVPDALAKFPVPGGN